MPMLRIKLETFEQKADDKGYISEVNRYDMAEFTVLDNPDQRQKLFKAMALVLGVNEDGA